MNTNQKIMRGEVYYIFPTSTTGSEQRSGRPAVVVSNNTCNSTSTVIEVAYMTLSVKPSLPTHVFVDRGPCINSTVLCEQITSVSKERVGDYMCRLPDNILDEVDKALAISLGLSFDNTVVEVAYDEETSSEETTDLEKENKALKSELDSVLAVLEDFEAVKSKAVMYEKLYNDLLDRILKRG